MSLNDCGRIKKTTSIDESKKAPLCVFSEEVMNDFFISLKIFFQVSLLEQEK